MFGALIAAQFTQLLLTKSRKKLQGGPPSLIFNSYLVLLVEYEISNFLINWIKKQKTKCENRQFKLKSSPALLSPQDRHQLVSFSPELFAISLPRVKAVLKLDMRSRLREIN